MSETTRPTADPELAALFDRAQSAWKRWIHKPAEQVPLPLRPR